MKPITDETHDSERRSFVNTATDQLGDFPIQNLPFGIFSRGKNAKKSAGVAIGDQIFDLHAASRLGLLSVDISEEVFAEPSLNGLFALGRERLRQLRKEIGEHLMSAPMEKRPADVPRTFLSPWHNALCIVQLPYRITPTFMPASTMPKLPARCSPRKTRFPQITNGCR